MPRCNKEDERWKGRPDTDPLNGGASNNGDGDFGTRPVAGAAMSVRRPSTEVTCLVREASCRTVRTGVDPADASCAWRTAFEVDSAVCHDLSCLKVSGHSILWHGAAAVHQRHEGSRPGTSSDTPRPVEPDFPPNWMGACAPYPAPLVSCHSGQLRQNQQLTHQVAAAQCHAKLASAPVRGRSTPHARIAARAPTTSDESLADRSIRHRIALEVGRRGGADRRRWK